MPTRSLRQARRERLLSIRGLAGRAGVSHVTVIGAESGRRTPSYGTVRRLSDALGVDPREVAEFRRAMGLPANDNEQREGGE